MCHKASIDRILEIDARQLTGNRSGKSNFNDPKPFGELTMSIAESQPTSPPTPRSGTFTVGELLMTTTIAAMILGAGGSYLQPAFSP
jgi:hypothetical protein